MLIGVNYEILPETRLTDRHIIGKLLNSNGCRLTEKINAVVYYTGRNVRIVSILVSVKYKILSEARTTISSYKRVSDVLVIW